MKECTKHRDAVVRFGPYHAVCPLCAADEAEPQDDEFVAGLEQQIEDLEDELEMAYKALDNVGVKVAGKDASA